MAKQSLVSIAAQDELCNWEFINQSDFELNTSDDDDSSIYEVLSIDLLDSLSSSSEHDPQEEPPAIDLDSHHDDDVDDHDDDAVMESPPIHTFDEVNCARVLDLAHHLDVNHDNFSNYATDLGYDDGNRHLHLHHHQDDVDVDDEGESDDDDDGDYDVDDELVPWGVKDKFERQRIRKLGKRSFAKMTKSKRSALIYTRPGCVRGKHGLGLKAF